MEEDKLTTIRIAGLDIPEWKLKRALLFLQFVVVFLAITSNSRVIIKNR